MTDEHPNAEDWRNRCEAAEARLREVRAMHYLVIAKQWRAALQGEMERWTPDMTAPTPIATTSTIDLDTALRHLREAAYHAVEARISQGWNA